MAILQYRAVHPMQSSSQSSLLLCLSYQGSTLNLRQKKTRQGYPRGFADNVQTLLLAGTIATRTHAPLARHLGQVLTNPEGQGH
jgi:hypothetical protein